MTNLQYHSYKHKQIYQEMISSNDIWKNKLPKLIKNQKGSQTTILHVQRLEETSNNQVFISKQERFRYVNNQSPGPGAYSHTKNIEQTQKTQNYHKPKQKQYFISKQHQWIFGNSRTPFAKYGSEVGPGAYQVSKTSFGNLTETWSKAQRFNGKQWGINSNQLGPGAYECKNIQFSPVKKSSNGVFKSKSPKSFLQQLQRKNLKQNKQNPQQAQPIQIFDTNDLQDMESFTKNKQMKLKSLQNKSKMSPQFLSKSKRYDLVDAHINKKIGPGSYTLSSTSIIKKPILSHIKSKTRDVNSSIIKSVHENLPGPAYYDSKLKSIESEIAKKVSVKGSMPLEDRFKEQTLEVSKKKQLPGPGQYNKKRFVFIDEGSYIKSPSNNQQKKHQYPFLSSSSRQNLETHNTLNSPFGKYNVNQFDLAQKIKKKKQHLQKLKMMDISVPGFESSQRRTVFNLGKVGKQVMQKLFLKSLQKSKSKSNLKNQ